LLEIKNKLRTIPTLAENKDSNFQLKHIEVNVVPKIAASAAAVDNDAVAQLANCIMLQAYSPFYFILDATK